MGKFAKFEPLRVYLSANIKARREALNISDDINNRFDSIKTTG